MTGFALNWRHRRSDLSRPKCKSLRSGREVAPETFLPDPHLLTLPPGAAQATADAKGVIQVLVLNLDIQPLQNVGDRNPRSSPLYEAFGNVDDLFLSDIERHAGRLFIFGGRDQVRIFLPVKMPPLPGTVLRQRFGH